MFWLEVDLVQDGAQQSFHVLKEHHASAVGGSVPKGEVWLFLGSWLHEVDVDVDRSSFLLRSFEVPLNQFFSFLLADHHGGNADACARAVVREHQVVDVLVGVIDDDSSLSAVVGDITCLGDVGALSSLHDDNWRLDLVVLLVQVVLEEGVRHHTALPVL